MAEKAKKNPAAVALGRLVEIEGRQGARKKAERGGAETDCQLGCDRKVEESACGEASTMLDRSSNLKI